MEVNREILVSIIIPVYQAKDTLERCVLSCLNQKFVESHEMEVILVDDGSTDGSGDICDRLAGDTRDGAGGNIKVVHTSNAGVSHARNIGIERASGRFLVFVDSDDEVKESYLENLMKYADEETSLVAQTKSYEAPRKISGFQYIENSVLNRDTHVWGKLFERTSVIENDIRFKEGLAIGEDLLFLLDFAIAQGKKYTIRCVDEGDYIYNDNAGGAMKSAFKESYMGELVSWKEAEEKLTPYSMELSRYAFVSLAVNQIMTAFLVVGKVAVLDDSERDSDLARLAISESKDQIEYALKTQGAFAGLPMGHKLKVLLFRISPSLYLKMYHNHKA
jgi:glycosyltransferase involved in cell wall biosynthesis